MSRPLDHLTRVDGSLELESDPVGPFDAATKRYVDTATASVSGAHLEEFTSGEDGPELTVRMGVRAAFVWWAEVGENIAGHGYYQVQMSTQGDFSTVVDDVRTKSSWVTFDGLVTGQTYFWRVRGVDAAGNTTAWTATAATAAPESVGEGDLADGAVTTVKIGDAAITSAKIGAAAVGTAQIANAAIGNAQIANGAITSAKIGNAQVDTAQIATAAIENAKIGNLAVTTLKIADDDVTVDKMGEFASVKSVGVSDPNVDISNSTANRDLSPEITTPSWATSAQYIFFAHSYATNGSATTEALFVRVWIAGDSGATYRTQPVAAGDPTGSVMALKQRTISFPGATVKAEMNAYHTGAGTWTDGYVNANFIAYFIK